MEACKIIQERFYVDFPAHPKEKDYNYACPSTIKPTQMVCAKGSLNQIPPHCTISGDIRLTPFYDCKAVIKAVNGYVAELNNNLSGIPTRGPSSKYVLEDMSGKLELTWNEMELAGIACDLTSPGFASIMKALEEVKGVAKPFSVSGSLPLVRELQEAGLDLQLIGFGLSSTYHANDEYCLLSDMEAGIKVSLSLFPSLSLSLSDMEARIKVSLFLSLSLSLSLFPLLSLSFSLSFFLSLFLLLSLSLGHGSRNHGIFFFFDIF